MAIQDLGLNPRKVKRELLGNIAVFLDRKLVLRSKPKCATIRINAPTMYIVVVKDNYSIASSGRSVAIYVDNRPIPRGLRNDPYFVPRPIDVVLHSNEFSNIEKNTMELLLTSKGSECNFKAGEERIVLPLGDKGVDVYVFGKKYCVLISGRKDAIMKYHLFIKPYDILKDCEKEPIIQIINAPREFRDPELLTQKTESP